MWYAPQVLRYARGGKPLWISDRDQLPPPPVPPLAPAAGGAAVPRCEYCDGPREFEFQVMPQLLHSLVT